VIAWSDLENGGNWGLELQNVFVIGVPQNTKLEVELDLKNLQAGNVHET
jgi:hypothetical protein